MKLDKQTVATVSALVLGVAGALGWVRPTDTAPTIKAYDVTKGAIETLDMKVDRRYDELHERQHDFERWIAERLAGLDRDMLPEHVTVNVPGHYELPPTKPDKPSVPAKLPTAADVLK